MQQNAGWPVYLTTAEAAAYLRLRERTIYDLVARSAIPCARPTGKLLFPRAAIDRWVEAHIEGAGPPPAPPPIVAGSSDPLLEWALRESDSGLAALFEGSAAGLARFAAGEAVAAGLHLPNEADDETNTEAVDALAFEDVVLVYWAVREQGLVTAAGNPLGLAGIADAWNARIAVRQPGAGGHALLRRLALSAGLDPDTLRATGVPARTDLDVAIAVADGEADCGLAVGAVATRFGLGFVPLHRERFDLAVRRRDYFEPPFQRLMAFTRTPTFTVRSMALGWTDVSQTGAIRLNGARRRTGSASAPPVQP